jgi:gas vesicle protein
LHLPGGTSSACSILQAKGKEVFMAEHHNFRDDSGSATGHSSVRVALAFLLIGIGVGSLVAAVLTPKTGKQLRKDLRRRYEDARDTMEELGDQAADLWQRGSGWAQAAGNKVAPIARKLKRDIR